MSDQDDYTRRMRRDLATFCAVVTLAIALLLFAMPPLGNLYGRWSNYWRYPPTAERARE